MRSQVPGRAAAVTTSLLAAFLIASLASAQTTTGTLRGTVKDETGSALPGATVEAINDDTGFRSAATTETSGLFNILVAPGPYTVTATLPSFSTESKKVRVLVGQIVRLDFDLKVATRVSEQVTVSASAAVDLRTPEIATNVTPEQIRYLPQNSRNFLNLAKLAPGVNVTADFGEDTRYSGAMFRSGGQDARQVNVFIDGVSYKNDILKGGAFMQDASRGNPFPQASVSEFQVLTQNYKAEYENAAAAIINVSTRSGTNELHGDGFFYLQNREMVARTIFQEGRPKPDYKRYQWGASLGGPLIHDKLFFFATYERNDQDRFNNILFGRPSTAPPEVLARFDDVPEGDLKAPFKSDLAFAKLTWQPAAGHTAELTGSLRDESERRDFGGRTAFSSGVDQKVKTWAFGGRLNSVFGANLFNDASLSYQDMKWTQGAIDTSTPHLNFFDIGEIGGRSTIQNVQQKRFTIRDVGTLTVGNHVAKGGVTLGFAKYDYDNAQDFNPTFFFRSQDRWLFPYEARFGFGQSAVKFDNTQLGLFVQDDWSITPRLQLNAGLRWQYESNQLNNDYETPADVIAAVNAATATDANGNVVHLGDAINLSDYISTGSNRDSYKGEWQPRIGLSYDVFGSGNTVFHGAWGRYWDHVNLQDIYLEQQRSLWRYFTFCFTDPRTTASPTCPNPITWNDNLLSRAGLEGLIASGAAQGPEIYLFQNSTKPPRSDQWNVGVNQRLGSYLFGLSYNNVRGYNGLIWFPAAPLDIGPERPDRFGHLFRAPGFGTILYSSDDRRTWYKAWFVTVERPFTASSRWGFTFAYTYAEAEQLGNENKVEGTEFGFDFFNPNNLRKVRGDNDERHHVSASAIYLLPWDIRFSALLTLGSGVPYTIFDFSHEAASIRWNAGNPPRRRNIFGYWAYESLDLRLDKDFLITGGVRLGVTGQVFNVTNFKNYCGFEGFYLSADLGKPNCQYNTRRAQVGVNIGF
jgi:outer membrane receptor protein involved in Fe transport